MQPCNVPCNAAASQLGNLGLTTDQVCFPVVKSFWFPCSMWKLAHPTSFRVIKNLMLSVHIDCHLGTFPRVVALDYQDVKKQHKKLVLKFQHTFLPPPCVWQVLVAKCK